jgi:hypothetical protein
MSSTVPFIYLFPYELQYNILKLDKIIHKCFKVNTNQCSVQNQIYHTLKCIKNLHAKLGVFFQLVKYSMNPHYFHNFSSILDCFMLLSTNQNQSNVV